jgi:hypothetical protein
VFYNYQYTHIYPINILFLIFFTTTQQLLSMFLQLLSMFLQLPIYIYISNIYTFQYIFLQLPKLKILKNTIIVLIILY